MSEPTASTQANTTARHTPEFEFFYDCSSPWTYLAFARILPICEALDISIDWRPIIVGGVFNEVNQQVYTHRASFLGEDSPKSRYFFKDMADWARLAGIELIWPEGHPVNAVKAMRGALYAQDQGALVPYSLAVFKTYWAAVTAISPTTGYWPTSPRVQASTPRPC